MTSNQPTIEIVDGDQTTAVECERTRTPYIWWDQKTTVHPNSPGWVLRTFTDDTVEDKALFAEESFLAVIEARIDRPELRGDPDDIRADVIEAGKLRSEIEQQRGDIMARLNFLVVEAHESGMGPSELSKLSGLSRRAIYDWIDG